MNRLKALRQRFIVINMVTITFMLLIILSIVIIGNMQHYKTVAFESLHTLVNMTNPVNTFSSNSDPGASRFQDANRDDSQPLSIDQSNETDTTTSGDNATIDESTETPDDTPPPEASSRLDAKEQKAALALPGIVVAVDDNYDNAEIIFSRNMDTSTSTAKKLVQAVEESDNIEGTLEEYDISYSIRQTPEGIKIAFVDRSYETSNIRNLLFWSLLVFFLAWFIFLCLVWRLSNWVFRPVETAWAQQRQFIADASHELKTPLTVILANIRILKNHREDTIADQERWIISSNQEALRMKKLVSDLLLLARNDANEDQPIVREQVLFSDVVLGAILSFESVALDNGLHICETIAENCVLEGDKTQLEELVNILLDNACKYAPAGTAITVILARQDKSLRLSVHNKGATFDDDTLKHLFERFYRVDESRTRQTGGYGLGLAIAESICHRHQGSISASNEDDGVTFHVSLPINQHGRKFR